MDFDSQLSTYMPTYPEQVLGECSLVRIHPEKLYVPLFGSYSMPLFGERVRKLSLVKFCQNLPCARTCLVLVLGYSLFPKSVPHVRYDRVLH